MVGFGASTSDYVDVGRLPSGYGVRRISLGARRTSGHDKCDRSENRNRKDGYAATVTLDFRFLGFAKIARTTGSQNSL
ncbi:hypothetical protein A3852_10075 [Rhodococcus qingshengii]|nr:hypothetical protein A3852_10075 [Rhodococcus qingshengii]